MIGSHLLLSRVTLPSSRSSHHSPTLGFSNPQMCSIVADHLQTVDDSNGFEMSEEHSEYRWVTAEEAKALFPHPQFMGRLIARAERFRAIMPLELRPSHWDSDFEF
mgnify:FL=1